MARNGLIERKRRVLYPTQIIKAIEKKDIHQLDTHQPVPDLLLYSSTVHNFFSTRVIASENKLLSTGEKRHMR
jgi:hypothetical protein